MRKHWTAYLGAFLILLGLAVLFGVGATVAVENMNCQCVQSHRQCQTMIYPYGEGHFYLMNQCFDVCDRCVERGTGK